MKMIQSAIDSVLAVDNGASLLEFAKVSASLCLVLVRKSNCEFVVWLVNTESGECCHGHYSNQLSKAHVNFAGRYKLYANDFLS